MADNSNVVVKVKSSLQQLIDELDKIKGKANEVQEEFKNTGNGVTDNLGKNTKETEKFFSNLRGLSRRVGDQLRRDFKSLVSVNALADGIKLSNQFRGTIAETVQLSDKIRKLGTTFGIARQQFASFQSFLTKGLGEIGMSSDVAARALEGLSTTSVRGQGNLLAYSTTSGMLGSLAGEQGSEGQIARGLSDVILARGGNVNDQGQLNQVAEAVRRAYVTSGSKPTETLANMKALFAAMPQDMRKNLTSEGMANVATLSGVAGPGAIRFFEEYLSKSSIERMPIDMQGGAGIIGSGGINLQKLESFLDNIGGRIGQDPRMAMKTLGISEEAAEGLVRMKEQLGQMRAAAAAAAATTGDLANQYKNSRSMGEAFKANLSKVKALIADPLSSATDTVTGGLNSASESGAGAAAVVAGGGLLASILTGKALKGLGGGLLGSVAKGAAAEQFLGEKTVPVYVVNAAEIGGFGLGSNKMGTGGIADKTAGAASTLGVAGLLKGSILALAGGALLKHIIDTNVDSISLFKDAIDNANRDKLPDGIRAVDPNTGAKPIVTQSSSSAPSSFPTPPVRVIIETKETNLRARTVGPSQGASN